METKICSSCGYEFRTAENRSLCPSCFENKYYDGDAIREVEDFWDSSF